jgi:hypothetical protein
MSKKSAPRKTSRALTHHVPLGLQLAARALDPDADAGYIKTRLADADSRAARILVDPLRTLEGEGANADITALADAHGAKKAADRIAAVIPESATHDPHAWITDAIVPHETAALYLGLCLGFRIAQNFSGKE